MNGWSAYYKDRVNNLDYYNYFKKKYDVFLSMLAFYAAYNDGYTLETGCGIATCLKILDLAGYDRLEGFDHNLEMLKLAYQNTSKQHKIHLFESDILETHQYYPNRLKTIFSHGVLEHFTNSELNRIINAQLTKGRINTLLHYVPSYKYVKPSFGDERLLKPKEWYDIFDERNKPQTIVEFNDGYDLILIWNNKTKG